MSKRKYMIIIALVIISVLLACFVYFSTVSEGEEFPKDSMKITLLDWTSRNSIQKGEQGLLMEKAGWEEDTLEFPLVFNPSGESFQVVNMHMSIYAQVGDIEAPAHFLIILNGLHSQDIVEYVDETAISQLSIPIDSELFSDVRIGINNITFSGLQEQVNLLFYRIELFIEYEYQT